MKGRLDPRPATTGVARRLARSWAPAAVIGLALEAGPLAIGALIGRPLGLAAAGIGFILAWAAIAAARRPDGELDPMGGLRALVGILGSLLAAYGIGVVAGTAVLVTTAFVVGLVSRDLLAGALVLAFLATLLARFAYVVPCLVDGDDLWVALERSLVLAGARGIRGVAAILALAAAALGPPLLVAELIGATEPAGLLSTLVTLAASGPILVFGLERQRPSLEAAARVADPSYGRVGTYGRTP